MQLQYECKAYTNFKRGIASDATRVDYDGALQLFMNYLKKTDPEQLLKGTTTKLEDQIMDWIADQKTKNLTYSTIRQRVAALRHFYEMNRKPLSWKVITKTIGKPTAKKDRGYTHEELGKMLQIASIREEAAILLMASGGLRIGAFYWKDDRRKEHYLQLKHLKRMELKTDEKKGDEQAEAKYAIYRILVYEGAEEEYLTFCTPEAAAAFDRYLEFRKSRGEKLTPESPLLRKEFDWRDPDQVAKVEPFTTIGLRTAIDNILVSAGIKKRVKCGKNTRPGTVRHETKIAHAMKKFASTNMVRGKVEATYREYMLSHKKGRKEMKVDQLEMIYDRPEDSDLLREYIKAIPFLTISKENKLMHEVETLKAATSDMDIIRKNYVDMKMQLERNDEDFEKRVAEQLAKRLPDEVAKIIAEYSRRVDLGKLK